MLKQFFRRAVGYGFAAVSGVFLIGGIAVLSGGKRV